VNTEQVVYLLRKTSLTRSEIGKLTPAQFNEILSEVYYQESQDIYREQYSVASIMAAIYNTIPRRQGSKVYKASDFIKGESPTRTPPKDYEVLAKERGITLPNKELKER
jgi:hypothetical protein